MKMTEEIAKVPYAEEISLLDRQVGCGPVPPMHSGMHRRPGAHACDVHAHDSFGRSDCIYLSIYLAIYLSI